MTLYLQQIGLVVCACVFTMFGSTAAADVIFVPADFPTIQAAIDAAQDGDVVVLDDGVYQGRGNRDIRFDGKSITVRSAFGATNCVIDAQGTSEKPFRGFIFDSGETTDSVLDGLTICGGATLPGAIADQFNGGGLMFVESSATIKNCIINDNACGCWGAGVYCNIGSSPILINCEISNNHAGDDGGGIFTWNGGTATLVNCNLNDNSAVVTGGAISSFGGGDDVSLINCCLANNDAPFGSAVLGWDVNIANSIIWGDSAAELIYQNSATIQYSTVQGGYPGVGNIDRDPMFVDPADGDYHLQIGSPCIDAADKTIVPEWVNSDADGQTRFFDDPNSVDTGNGSAPMVDMGTFEFQQVTSLVSPDSVEVTRGVVVSGNLNELDASDDVDYRIRTAALDSQSQTEFQIKGVSPVANPALLGVTLEGSLNPGRDVLSPALTYGQVIEFYNYEDEEWEVVDSRIPSLRRDGSPVVVGTTGDLSRFVEVDTLCIEARVRYSSTRAAQSFISDTDQFIWRIIP